MKTVSIIFCGIGGQGILTASEICAYAAMYEGYHVKKSEVKGMSQRGGSVESFVRFGSKVYSPLVPRGEADFLVGFDEREADLWSVYLRRGGIDMVLALRYGRKAISSPRFLNIFMLGALSVYLKIKEENWFKALKSALKGRAFESNRAVFRRGREFIKDKNA